MDNQHQKITGFRDLTQDEIDLMNEIKAREAEIATIVREVQARAGGTRVEGNEPLRQATIARTEFEHAFMRLVRAVARPVSPWVS